ncbi:MAG: PTS glucitol/sorbitol transporter subunit IIA [Roseiarcus sp.]|jgi:PTS system glucitol/sorbitol-specific IIA component
MTEHFRTVVTQVSKEALELVEGGILILFADGAPPELAEVSVLHRVISNPTAEAPAVGAVLRIDGMSTKVTAVGEEAWKKIDDMGHVVINFDGAAVAPRPGEISVAPVDLSALAAVLQPGIEISLQS